MTQDYIQPNAGQPEGRTARLHMIRAYLVLLILFFATTLYAWSQVSHHLLIKRGVHGLAALDVTMQAHLQAGVPLSEFAGFERISESMLRVAPKIVSIVIRTADDRPIFWKNRTGIIETPPIDADALLTMKNGRTLGLEVEDDLMRMAMPLHGPYGKEGSLEVELRRDLQDLFEPLYFGIFAGLLILIGVVYWFFLKVIATDQEVCRWYRKPVSVLAQALLILALAAAFLGMLTEKRASDTAEAIATSFGARIDQAMTMGIDPGDLAGLDLIVEEMRQSDEMVSHVALIEGSEITTAAGVSDGTAALQLVDRPLTATFELRPRQIYHRQFQVSVGMGMLPVLRLVAEQAWLLLFPAIALLLLIWIQRREGGEVCRG
ncbi:hypothetical protein [Aestuariispira insulae]|uniref:Uncharacterized protein n=1 Tax=Aestuariispira insulae TaxID=1461337 RepID=A0A3D9HV28_9PROT|nr:hypothetical protein [Aestuariispira insulae]RED53231.1 hypothetical protein DFP90_10113 [Aestuariispira insulae]